MALPYNLSTVFRLSYKECLLTIQLAQQIWPIQQFIILEEDK